MYEWLVEEAKQIGWRNFHSFHRHPTVDTAAEVAHRFGDLPHDYLRFGEQFGESLMFRDLKGGFYNMGVLASPRIHDGLNGELLLEIGFFINSGSVYLRKKAGSDKPEIGAFEGDGLRLRRTADSFEEWLSKRFQSARKLFNKSEWQRIVEGAKPFTPAELQIVEAISLFSFERVGIAENGDTRIQVFNGSTIRLPYLTIGVKAPGRLNGRAYLDVSGIGPGETKIVESPCYKSIVGPIKVELFRNPVPEPEDKEAYYEFGAPETMTISNLRKAK